MVDKTAVHEFLIAGINEPARIVMAGPLPPRFGRDDWLSVTVAYQGLSATWPIYGINWAAFSAFFGDLAANKEGWQGVKSVESLDGDFTIEGEYKSYKGQWQIQSGDPVSVSRRSAEVWMNATLASDTQDPYWLVELRLVLHLESLPALADRAREFFHLCAASTAEP
jgi:hypothetical protein